jgi:hypothetical protein
MYEKGHEPFAQFIDMVAFQSFHPLVYPARSRPQTGYPLFYGPGKKKD